MSSSDRFTQIAVGAAMFVTVILFMVVHGPSLGSTPDRGSRAPSAIPAVQVMQQASPAEPARTALRASTEELAAGAAEHASLPVDARTAGGIDDGELVDQLVAASDAVTRGQLAAIAGHHLPTPAEVRVFRDRDQRMVVAPGTSRRYAEAVDELLDLDAARIAAALDREWSRASASGVDGTADSRRDRIVEAIDQLLEVELPELPADMVAGRSRWDFADPEYAGLSDAQKHLLLMGLGRARKVQAKLQEIRDSIVDSSDGSTPLPPSPRQLDAMPMLAAAADETTPIQSVATAP